MVDKQKQKRKARGVCSGCGGPRDRINRFTCSDCSVKRVSARREQRNRYKAVGLCECGNDPRPGKATCADCVAHRMRSTRKRNSLCDEATYQAFKEAQNGVCAICGGNTKNALHADHDPVRGIVRGLLCGRCNPMIGMAKHDPDILRAAITYLEDTNRG